MWKLAGIGALISGAWLGCHDHPGIRPRADAMTTDVEIPSTKPSTPSHVVTEHDCKPLIEDPNRRLALNFDAAVRDLCVRTGDWPRTVREMAPCRGYRALLVSAADTQVEYFFHNQSGGLVGTVHLTRAAGPQVSCFGDVMAHHEDCETMVLCAE
jgi:hypothetical protein